MTSRHQKKASISCCRSMLGLMFVPLRTLSRNSKKQRILTLTESECSVILILVFLCQQTLRVDIVCVWACLLSRLETGLVPISSSDPLPSVLSAISTGVGKGSTLPIGPIWGQGESPLSKFSETQIERCFVSLLFPSLLRNRQAIDSLIVVSKA